MANLRDKLRDRDQPKRRSAQASVKKPGAPAQTLDFNPRLLLIAAGVAGFAALLAVVYLVNVSAGIAGKGAKVAVWVTRTALLARHDISAADVETRDMPQNFLASGYLTRDESPVGRITLAPVARGEVLLDIRVAEPGARTGVTPKLQAGERGFVLIPEGAQDIPLVKPDDMVDLIATLPEPNNAHQMISTPVLQLVRVLSVGDRLSSNASASGDPQTDNGAMTLAVPANKVSLLTILKQDGNLHLALRAPGDQTILKSAIAPAQLAAMVMGQIPRPQPRPRPMARPRVVYQTRIVHDRPKARPRPAPPSRPQVQIYNGTQRQN